MMRNFSLRPFLGANFMDEAQPGRGGLVDNLVDNLFDGAMKVSPSLRSTPGVFSSPTSRRALGGLQRLFSQTGMSSRVHRPTSKSSDFVHAESEEPKGFIEKFKSNMPP